MPELKKVRGKIVLGLTKEEQEEQEKEERDKLEQDRPMLALKEIQEYLITQGLNPKHKL